MPIIARRVSMPALSSFGALVAVDVLTVQCGLWQLGFDPGRFDGLWGPMTEGALDRWYAWWRSTQRDDPGVPEYESPPRNRGGVVRMPEAWASIAAAAERGPCNRERRGQHRSPPVPEPQPLAPPPVVVGPSGEPEPERPINITTQTESSGMGAVPLVVGVLAIGAIAAAIAFTRRDDDDIYWDIYPINP